MSLNTPVKNYTDIDLKKIIIDDDFIYDDNKLFLQTSYHNVPKNFGVKKSSNHYKNSDDSIDISITSTMYIYHFYENLDEEFRIRFNFFLQDQHKPTINENSVSYFLPNRIPFMYPFDDYRDDFEFNFKLFITENKMTK
jgi:hypothetical protein